MVDVGPPQPRLLDDVLGVGGGAEHLVGDGEQQAAVARERVLAHADVAYPAEGCASGSAHALENPWDSIPSAVLPLAAHVRERDPGRELHQGRRTELLEQPGRQLVGDPRGRLGHRLGVLHDVTLERA